MSQFAQIVPLTKTFNLKVAFFRGFALQKTIAPEPIPEPASEPEMPPPMWQVLGLQRAPNSDTTAPIESEQNPEPENRSKSPESDDDSFTGITIKMEVDETVKSKQIEKPDDIVAKKPDDIVAEKADDIVAEKTRGEEEERPASAMSLFSNDSDDDPTWAPSPEKLKKVCAVNIAEKPRLGRKPNTISPLKSLKKVSKIAEKRAKKEEKKLKKEERKLKKERMLKEKKEKKTKLRKKQKKDDLTKTVEANSDVTAKMTADDDSAKMKKSGSDFHFLCTFCKYMSPPYQFHNMVINLVI